MVTHSSADVIGVIALFFSIFCHLRKVADLDHCGGELGVRKVGVGGWGVGGGEVIDPSAGLRLIQFVFLFMLVFM